MNEHMRKTKGRHERNKLNVKQVASLVEPGIYSDGGGLYVRVRPSGTRSWVYVYSRNGKRAELGLGSLFDVTLAKAREKALAARTLVLEGGEPQALKPQLPERVKASSDPTFGQFTNDWLDSIEDGFRNQKHRQQWRNTLNTYAAPLYQLAIDAINTTDVLSVLQPIWLTKSETASRVRGRIERVLDAAKAKGLRSGENPATYRGNLDLLLPKQTSRVRHHPALPFPEIAGFMTELASRPATAARALEFTILTAARSGEVRGMTWSELDLGQKLWTIPGERMKAGATHQVPLSDAAIAILKDICPKAVRPSDIVFHAPKGGMMSDMALSQLLKRMGRNAITVHGFRSTFRDWAGEATQFAREEVEMALAHTVESQTERAYRRGRALEKRRSLMVAWERYCLDGE